MQRFIYKPCFVVVGRKCFFFFGFSYIFLFVLFLSLHFQRGCCAKGHGVGITCEHRRVLFVDTDRQNGDSLPHSLYRFERIAFTLIFFPRRNVFFILNFFIFVLSFSLLLHVCSAYFFSHSKTPYGHTINESLWCYRISCPCHNWIDGNAE